MKLLKILSEIAGESGVKDEILSKSPKVTNTIAKLLTSNPSDLEKALDEIEEIVKDIKVISFKPSTFRVIFQNDNFFDLIYSPINNKDDVSKDQYYTLFLVSVNGKRYHLVNNSEMEQAMDYINRNLKTSSSDTKTEEPPLDNSEEGSEESEPENNEKENEK